MRFARSGSGAVADRRLVVARLGAGIAAVCLPLAPRAQPGPAPPVVAVLAFGTAPAADGPDPLRAFLLGLRDAGLVEGRDVQVERRYGDGRPEQLAAQAEALVRVKVDVIVAAGPLPREYAGRATATIPIVAIASADPVREGWAQSLARPGGNITGISSFGGELVARRLQLLKDFVPQGKRFAVLANPNYLDPAGLRNLLDRLEPQVGAPVSMVLATGPEQYDAAFAELTRLRVDGVVVLADPTTWTHRERLQQLVLAHKLPSVWGGGPYLGEAGLASYQSDFPALWRRAGAIVAKVLNGANPADVPFEQASKLELVVNLKAARRLGIEVPQSILISADKVIE